MNDTQDSVSRTSESQGSFSRVFRGCFVAILAALLISMLGIVAVVGFILVGVAMQAQAPRRFEPVALRELHLSGPVGAPKIAVINVEGLIYGSSKPSGRLTPVSTVSAKLDRAHRDPQVRGVLLFVDSAGGGVTGSDILRERLERLRTEDDAKPVVASILDIGASGAYYSICGVDKIMAHPTSLTGSIGVLMPLYDATGLMEKIGISEESILSGDYKDIGSPFSERTEEMKERQRELLKEIVDSMHERFVSSVAAGRGLDHDQVAAVADGRIMTAEDARDAGLIDAIGYENDAVEVLSNMIDVPDPKLVAYRRERSLGALITSFATARGLDLSFLPFSEERLRLKSRPMYLWTGEDP